MKTFRKEDVVGKTIIETSGRSKGKVKDLMFNLNGEITLIVEGDDGKEFQVPLAKVTGISQHVVVKSDVVTEETPSNASACKFCGAFMTPGQRWCPACGKAQA